MILFGSHKKHIYTQTIELCEVERLCSVSVLLTQGDALVPICLVELNVQPGHVEQQGLSPPQLDNT